MVNTEQDRVRQIIEDGVIGGRQFGFNDWNKTIGPMDYGDPDKPKMPVTGPDLGHSAARGGQCYDQFLG